MNILNIIFWIVIGSGFGFIIASYRTKKDFVKFIKKMKISDLAKLMERYS